MKCASCGAPGRPGLKFCEEYGTRFGAACPSCGARVTPDKKFCGECGTRLATGEPESRATRYAAPSAYTPAHLAERILKDRGEVARQRGDGATAARQLQAAASLADTLGMRPFATRGHQSLGGLSAT